jgi:hypothetical protein
MAVQQTSTPEMEQLFCDASLHGNLNLVQQYLHQGVNVNASPAPGGWTALMNATLQGHAQIVDVLLQAGGALDLKDPGGFTAAMYSANYKRYAILEKLVARGADLTLRDNAGRDIYHYCSPDDPKVKEAIDRGLAMRAQGGGYGMEFPAQGMQPFQQQQGQFFGQNTAQPAAAAANTYPRNGFAGGYGNVQAAGTYNQQQAGVADAGAYSNPQQVYGAPQTQQANAYPNAAPTPAYGGAGQQQQPAYYGR